MAASNAYVALSATFNSGAIDGITDISVSINGSPVDLVTDAETSIETVFVDAIAADVTITTTDISAVTGFDPGDTNSLVIVFQKRAAGSGAAVAGNSTATFANATLHDISPSASVTGVSSTSLTFRCAGPDSTSPVAWT